MSDTKESQGPPIPQAEPLQLLLSGDPGEALPGAAAGRGFVLKFAEVRRTSGRQKGFLCIFK